MRVRTLIAALLLAPVIAGAAALWPRPGATTDVTDTPVAECNACTARHKAMLRNRAAP